MGGEAQDRGVRAFVAVLVPADVRASIVAIQRRLMGNWGVRWVEPENFHLTLRFLGQISPAADALRAGLRAVVAGRDAFAITLAGMGAFPSVRGARTIWLGVTQGARELEDLARVVEDAVAAEGFPPEARPFSAHLTLGRLNGSRAPAGLVRALEAEAQARAGEMPVAEVALMCSELWRSYTPLEAFRLRRSA